MSIDNFAQASLYAHTENESSLATNNWASWLGIKTASHIFYFLFTSAIN